MAVSRLSGRLERIRASQKNGATSGELPSLPRKTPLSNAVPAASVPLTGWEETAPFLFERTSRVALSGFRRDFSPHLPLLFPREREALSEEKVSAQLADSLVFFDLETTGLSHGAGTVAFMAGVARFEEEELRIHQILLSDYPGEPAFLARFIVLVGENPVFVSFNGKCFDTQILFTRFMMNAFKPSCLSRGVLHLDLLFPSRRLWKKQLGSCRLSIIENEILGVTRVDDLPGSEAPEAWFAYVRSGQTEKLLAIGDHNREDCISLARLLFALDDSIESASGRAALIRALHLRSGKDWEGAALLLETLAAEGDALSLRILAIDAEHRLCNLEKAYFFAEKLGDEKRMRRIQGKIEKSGTDKKSR